VTGIEVAVLVAPLMLIEECTVCCSEFGDGGGQGSYTGIGGGGGVITAGGWTCQNLGVAGMLSFQSLLKEAVLLFSLSDLTLIEDHDDVDPLLEDDDLMSIVVVTLAGKVMAHVSHKVVT
jgi:hypothetical protein